tara:strand:+ start:627 stop:1805 length:1179 start_codon:yes stop_codon:yes gene_type:complete
MAGEEPWRVADLLDQENQPFVEDVMLARQMVRTYSELKVLSSGSSHYGGDQVWLPEVRVPKQAIEFMENTLSEWFETVAQIEMRRGNLPYLIDRSLYSDGEINWNQGLKKAEIESWMGPYGLGPYPFMKTTKPTGEPLSGYYNRLLPVKFILRMMALLTCTSDNYDKDDGWQEGMEFEDFTLEELREKTWQTASYARNTLLMIDELQTAKGKKMNKISVGFPTEDEKSKERFVSQFVGSMKNKTPSGALFDMGFANMPVFLGLSTEEIYFTPFGWNFAMLENPVIDETDGWKDEGVFSKAEVNYLLEHFKQNVPAEWKFMVSIAEMIRDGTNDATKMNAELISKRDWNRSKASVYRTGVLARMQELGLVDREKSGVEVTFVLTEEGKKKLLK